MLRFRQKSLTRGAHRNSNAKYMALLKLKYAHSPPDKVFTPKQSVYVTVWIQGLGNIIAAIFSTRGASPEFRTSS